ncbi:MAG: GNAT family N-acetyltransferase [Flavobacterium sp.]
MTTFQLLSSSKIETITSMMQDFYAIDNYPIDIEVSKKLFQEFIADEKLGQVWLIYSNKNILGYLILTYIFSFEYQGRIAFLDELYIKESSRGKGIGKQAINFIKEQAALTNVKLIYLELENHNENAQKLYLANDFEVHNRKLLKLKLS